MTSASSDGASTTDTSALTDGETITTSEQGTYSTTIHEEGTFAQGSYHYTHITYQTLSTDSFTTQDGSRDTSVWSNTGNACARAEWPPCRWGSDSFLSPARVMAHPKKSATQQRKYRPRSSVGLLDMRVSFVVVRFFSSSFVFAW